MSEDTTGAVLIPRRPEFLEKLSHYYKARLPRCIALTGNIYDIFGMEKSGEVNFVSLEQVLFQALKNGRAEDERLEKFIIIVLRSNGIYFVSEQDKTELEAACQIIGEEFNRRRGEGAEKEIDLEIYAPALKSMLTEIEKRDVTPLWAIQKLANFLRVMAKIRELLGQSKLFVRGTKEHYIRPICVVIDQAHMIFPNLAIGQMGGQDREIWKVIHELLCDESVWPNDEITNRQDFIVLLSPAISALNPGILSLPKVHSIEIPAPDEDLIKAYSRHQLARLPISNFYGGKNDAIEAFARDSVGLTLQTIGDLLAAAHFDKEHFVLDRRAVSEEINKRIQLTLGKTVKFVRPQHTPGDVRGFRKLKPIVEGLMELFDDPKESPAGIIVPGPNGAGKTFFWTAYAVATGRAVVEIAGGMRDKYYGVAEQQMEEFEATLTGFSRVCVLVDEAHKAFGSIHDPDTFHAEALLARQVLQMMSNPKYRSKIMWILITTRPDILDPDFIRSGRCSIGLPMFDPEGEDADEFLDWMLERFARNGIELSDEDREFARKKTQEAGREFSAGDYAEAINQYIFRRVRLRMNISLKDFLNSWKSSAVKLGKKREFQLWLGAKHCDFPDELLPKRFRKEDGTPFDIGEIEEKIEDLRLLYGFKD